MSPIDWSSFDSATGVRPTARYGGSVDWDDFDRIAFRQEEQEEPVAPVAPAAAPAPSPEPEPGFLDTLKDMGRQALGGIAEGGNATRRLIAKATGADEFARLRQEMGQRSIGGDLFAPDQMPSEALQQERDAIQQWRGAPQTTAGLVTGVGSRVAFEGAQALAMGGGTAAAMGLRAPATLLGRVGRNAALGAPYDAMQAQERDTSLAGGLADVTESPAMDAVADNRAARTAFDTATGLVAGTAIEEGLRGAKTLYGKAQTIAQRGKKIGTEAAGVFADAPGQTIDVGGGALPPAPGAAGALPAPRMSGEAPRALLPERSSAPDFIAGPSGVRANEPLRYDPTRFDAPVDAPHVRGVPEPDPVPPAPAAPAARVVEPEVPQAPEPSVTPLRPEGGPRTLEDVENSLEAVKEKIRAYRELPEGDPRLAYALDEYESLMRERETLMGAADDAPPLRTGTEGFAAAQALPALALGTGGYLTGEDTDDSLKRALVGTAAGFGVSQVARSLDGLVPGKGFQVPTALKGAYDRAAGSIDFDGSLTKAAEKEGQGGWRQRFDRFLDSVANVHGPIERLGRAVDDKLRPSENPRDLLTLWKNHDATVSRAFNEGVPHPRKRDTVVGPSLKAVVEPLGDDHEAIKQAFTYAVQKRLVGRGVQGFGGDAQKYADAQALVNHFETLPEIKEFSARLEKYTDALGTYAVESGLWSPEQWKAIKNSDVLYIPTKRIMGQMVQSGSKGSPGSTQFGNVTSGVKDFVGSQRDVYDPTKALAEYTSAIIRRADSYRVGHGIIEAAQKMGPAGELLLTPVAPGKQRSIKRSQAVKGLNLPPQAQAAIDDILPTAMDAKNPVIWRNGPKGREEYVLNSPDLWRAIKSLSPQMDEDGLHQLLNKTLLPLKRVFTATTTGLAPTFVLGTNPVRDIPDALAKSQSKGLWKRIARGYAQGIAGAVGKSPFAKQMRDYGLGHVSLWDDAARTGTEQMQRSIMPTSLKQKARAKGRTAALRGSGITLLESVGNATEVGPRLAEASASIAKNTPRVQAKEWDVDDLLLRAATEGRELIDFTNRPGNRVLRELAEYVVFFNAALQGSASMTQAAVRDPKKVAGVASGIALASAVAWAMKHRSPEVLQKENDRLAAERASYLMVPVSEKHTLRIPLGQEMGLVASGVMAGLDAWKDQDPGAADLLRQSINRALPPIAGDLITEREFNVGIPGVQQALENTRNRKAFGNTPVEPRRMEGWAPEEKRQDPTPVTADLLAAGARKLGFKSTSPLQAENVLRGVTSRYTDFITAATDPVAGKIMGRSTVEGVPPAISRNPINPVSAFLANPSPTNTASEQRYYDQKGRTGEGENDFQRALKTKDLGLAERTLERRGEDLTPEVRMIVESADEQAKQWRNAQQVVRQAFQGGEIDAREARELLDEIAAREMQIYRTADLLIREVKSSQPTVPAQLASR